MKGRKRRQFPPQEDNLPIKPPAPGFNEEIIDDTGQEDLKSDLAMNVTNWISGGLDFQECMADAREWNAKNKRPMDDDDVRQTVEKVFNDHQNSNKSSKAKKDVIIRFARERIISPKFLLFHDEFKHPWVRCSLNGVFCNRPIYSRDTALLIIKLILDAFGVIISKTMVRELQDMFLIAAYFDGPQFPLHYRSAWNEDSLWIDIGDESHSAIRVSMAGWEIVSSKNVPPLFKRFSHMQALPTPVSGGSLEMLRKFVRIESDDTWILIQIWLIVALLPHIPRPGIILHGLQGAGKSYASKLLRSLIDPSLTPLLSLPGSEKELVQIMDHHFIIALDNMHKIKQGVSDALCRAVTGGGFSKRKQYTDSDDIIFQFIRPFILNGINIPASSPDLLDRAIIIKLDRIASDERRPEQELAKDFAEVQPYIFGAMLDALSFAMRKVVTVQMDKLPRMADFARWGQVVAEHLGIDGETFLEAYQSNSRLIHHEVINSDLVALAILRLAKKDGFFEGTPTELHKRCRVLLTEDEAKDRSWPTVPHAFSRRLKKVEHNLREMGVEVKSCRKHERSIKVTYVSEK